MPYSTMHEMSARNRKNKPSPPEGFQSDRKAPPEFVNELNERCWSVISFERVEANELTYNEAADCLLELSARGVSGLCIVTNEVAQRVSGT